MILCSSHLSLKPFLSFSFWLLWACSAHTLLLTSKSSVSLLKTPVFICFQQAYISLSQRAVVMSSADNTSVSVISALASVLVLLSASVESFWCSIGSVFLIKTYTLSAFCMLPVYTVFWCCSNKGNSDPHFANVKWRSEVPLSPITSVGKGSSAAAVRDPAESLKFSSPMKGRVLFTTGKRQMSLLSLQGFFRHFSSGEKRNILLLPGGYQATPVTCWGHGVGKACYQLQAGKFWLPL